VVGGDELANSSAGSDATIAELRKSIECDPDPNVHHDWIPMPDLMADVHGWLFVDEVSEASADYVNDEGRAVLTASGTVNGLNRINDATIQLFTGIVPPLRQALSDPEVDVYLGLGSVIQLRPENAVSVAVAVHGDSYSLLGQCGAAHANEEFEALYGDDAAAVIRQVAGLTGADARRVLGLDTPAQVSPEVNQIVPGMTHSAEEIAQYETRTLYVEWPEDVRTNDFIMCAKSSIAWGACVGLGAVGGDEPSGFSLVAPRDSETDVELWLFDSALDLKKPLEFVGAVPDAAFTNTAVAFASVEMALVPQEMGLRPAVTSVNVRQCDAPIVLAPADTSLKLCQPIADQPPTSVVSTPTASVAP
jgi:hypothetical protein